MITYKRDWYENGQLEYEYPYKNGKSHGICKGWHENGQLQYEWPYKNGKSHGIHKGWHENGQLRGEWPYINDKLVELNRYLEWKQGVQDFYMRIEYILKE